MVMLLGGCAFMRLEKTVTVLCVRVCVFQDCTNPRYLAAGSSNAVKLSRFFDKVSRPVNL